MSGLKQHKCTLTFLEAGSPRWRCLQGHGKELFLASFEFLLICHMFLGSDASLQSSVFTRHSPVFTSSSLCAFLSVSKLPFYSNTSYIGSGPTLRPYFSLIISIRLLPNKVFLGGQPIKLNIQDLPSVLIL